MKIKIISERYQNNHRFYFRLKKWPVFRDLFFYIISILLLFTFVLVGDSPLIYWYQALLPVCWYGIYLLTLAFDDKIGQKLKTCLKTQQEVCYVYMIVKHILFLPLDNMFEVNSIDMDTHLIVSFLASKYKR